MEKYIKNFPAEKAVVLKEQITCRQGEVVSKTLAQNQAVSITLFAFDAGEEIGTHDSKGDAMVTVLEGEGQFVVNGKTHVVKAGETLIMPANLPHAVLAKQSFKMLFHDPTSLPYA